MNEHEHKITISVCYDSIHFLYMGCMFFLLSSFSKVKTFHKIEGSGTRPNEKATESVLESYKVEMHVYIEESHSMRKCRTSEKFPSRNRERKRERMAEIEDLVEDTQRRRRNRKENVAKVAYM